MSDEAECRRQFEAFYRRDVKDSQDGRVPWGHSWLESRWRFWKAAWTAALDREGKPT